MRIRSPKATQPLRIVHLSDTQCAVIGDYEKSVFARVAALEPDRVLFMGDFLQPRRPTEANYRQGIAALDALFGTLHPPLGVVAVAGNVDRLFLGFPEYPPFQSLRILNDEPLDLNWPGGRVRIFGLTAPSSRTPNLTAFLPWFEATAPDDFTIVLGHHPEYATAVSGYAVDLCLAGHTHGGLIRVPWLGAVATLSHVPRELVRGFHPVGRTQFNVSAGVGCEHAAALPDIRLNCPPEITLIEVAPAGTPQTLTRQEED